MLIIGIILAIVCALVFAFMMYAVCVVAGDADRAEEKMWENRNTGKN